MSRSTEIVVRNYALAILTLAVGLATAEELILSVNVKKPLAVVSDKFLSITLDPLVLFNSDALSRNEIERSISMGRALSPAYVRIGGPRSNSYVFERGLYPQAARPEPGYSFSETHWIDMHKWAEKSGLDVVASLAPQLSDTGNSWDPRNALDLISFSDHLGYNTSWQLGYECQTRCETSGSELGRDVQRLRSMLDAFPRYSNDATNGGLLVGPDVVAYKTRQQQQYLQDYFNVAGSVLTAVTWHPDFAGISIEAEGVSMHHDNLALEKDNLYRVVGRYILKKPLWIAESKSEECKQQFLGALVWARRLGNSAKLGIQVLMRQPDNSNLFRSTPDYWVSMLHKMLVGREVLDTRIAVGNRTHLSFYSHCTRPTSRYEKGSITIFGINLTPTKITASVKGLKPKVVHKYIMLPGYDAPNRMFAETTLLNNELLTLIDGKRMPNIQPVVYSAEKGVKLKLPSGGIGFWVLPDLNIKTCIETEEDASEKNFLKKMIKQLEDSAAEEEFESDNHHSRESISLKNTNNYDNQHQRHIEKRQPLFRRGDRHRVIERNDLSEPRRVRMSQLELAKRDLERLDRIMHKRDNQAYKRKTDNIHGIFDKSEEEIANSEENILKKSVDRLKIEDTEKEIRAKLQGYKNRLESETRKRQSNATTERVKEYKEANKGMDTEKVIEALTLIAKVESAMKWLERDTENRTVNVKSSLGTGDLNGVSSDALLDKILKSEKSKRANVPTGVEDQLKALYHLLYEEKERRENESRQRRDLEQNPTGGSLDERRYGEDDPFNRKNVRERRQGRVERRRERQEQRKQQQQRQDDEETSEESEENEFHGFQTQPPLENFPEGDVYVQTGVESGEKVGVEQSQVPRSRTTAVTTEMPAGSEDGQAGIDAPNEFYENTGRQRPEAKKSTRSYVDMWEADPSNGDRGSKGGVDAVGEPANRETVVTEKSSMNYNNHQAAPIDPNNQSSTAPVHRQEQNPAGHYVQQPLPQTPDGSTVTPHRRAKRQTKDIETVLHQEMLSQDANNMKDCQCRVIRGLEECNDCVGAQQDVPEPLVVIVPAPVMQFPLTNDPAYRPRRDADEAVDATTAMIEDVDNSTCTNDEIEAATYELEHELATEIITLELSEAKAIEVPTTTTTTTTTTEKDELKLEDHGESIANNRLPRRVGESNPSVIRKQASKAKDSQESNVATNDTSTQTSTETSSPKTKDGQVTNAKVDRRAGKERPIAGKSAKVEKSSRAQGTSEEPRVERALKTPSTPSGKGKRAAKVHKHRNSESPNVDETTVPKIEEEEKPKLTKQATKSMTKAEALVALKKENESKRAQKMIEASLKAIENENAKFEEHQKKRREQLEKLKMKLRAKREKLLHQYRAELIEAIAEKSDDRKLPKRRDVKEQSKNATVENDVGETERIEPSEIVETVVEADGSDDDRKLSTPINIRFEDEIYDAAEDQEQRSANGKRSPREYGDVIEVYNRREPRSGYEIFGDDSAEYHYLPRRPYRPTVTNTKNRYYYYPQVYDKDGVAVDDYNSNHYHESTKPRDYTSIYKSAADARMMKNKDNNDDDDETTKQPLDENQRDVDQDEQDSLDKRNRQNKYSRISYDIIKPNYDVNDRNMRRPNLDPPMYEDDDADGYDLQQLNQKRPYRYSSRNYRHEPYGYIGGRYKRATVKKAMINGPLLFSLGLEKSKMKDMKDDVGSSIDIMARKKRSTENVSTFASRSPANKNIKKVLKNFDEKNRKQPKAATRRDKRSIAEASTDNHTTNENNGIDKQTRTEDPKMDEIRNNVIVMKQDEKLLEDYNKEKGKIIDDYLESQRNINRYLELAENSLSEEQRYTIDKLVDSTTQTNIESILVDTIPKIETVITGGLKKAENFTGNFEDFIETFEEDFEDSTMVGAPANNNRSTEVDNVGEDGRLSHVVFRSVIGSVSRFFHFVSGVTKMFQSG